MVAPVLVLVVALTQRPNPTEARPGHGDQSPRLRRPLAGRPDSARPPAHEPISDFGQGLPPGYGSAPQHTPALAHNALKPQAIARKRAFRKATHRFAPPATRKRTCLPRDKHYSGTARLWLVLSGGSARTHLRRRGASLRLAAHHVGGHPAICQPAPARACHAPSAGVTLARGQLPLES